MASTFEIHAIHAINTTKKDWPIMVRVIHIWRLPDVIGRLFGIGELEELIKDGKKQKRIEISLEDAEKNKVSCTLWGAFADDVLNLTEEALKKPVIIILQWFKIREFNSNHLDEDIELLTSQNSQSIGESLLAMPNRVKIEELSDCKHEDEVVTLGTVVDINTNRDWFYNACKKCNKEYSLIVMGSIAQSAIEKARLLFKVTFTADDDTGSDTFIMFDPAFSKFVNCTATHLRESIPKESEDEVVLSDCFYEFIGKEFVFKVSIRDPAKQGFLAGHIVTRFCEDSNVLRAYKEGIDDLPNSLHNDSHTETTTECDTSHVDSEVGNTGESTLSKSISSKTCLKLSEKDANGGDFSTNVNKMRALPIGASIKGKNMRDMTVNNDSSDDELISSVVNRVKIEK
ncbi:uncharacterized protein LOC129302549 [Prosopis cineraria]|uniref:uncharacterized protein LOC129302549 n=1 Tax=Prosopis cineraria TaxID=364024 RepID=UPI002410A27C|nr:uncharacterized protein LOC129302549 [Prosopis cineraria]